MALASALSLCGGLGIAWLDTRPRWDDAGVTASAITMAAAVGSFVRIPPWLAAVLVAGPIVAVELSRSVGVLIAVPLALAGAYGGAFVRRRIRG